MYKWVKKVICKLKAENPAAAGSTSAAHSPKLEIRRPGTEGQRAPSSKAVPQRSQSKVALLIGFDFGTHSTRRLTQTRAIGSRATHVLYAVAATRFVTIKLCWVIFAVAGMADVEERTF
jgi:hypothetical protein